MLLLRTYFLKECLDRGYTILTSDIDVVWEENVLLEFRLPLYAYADIVALDDTCDVPCPCGGLMYLRPTARGRQTWNKVVERYTAQVTLSITEGQTVMKDMTDQHVSCCV